MSKTTASIWVVNCPILVHSEFEAEQYILTLGSKIIAENTKPGQFVHLKVSAALAMRRPISVMSVDIENGTFDLLYKVVGEGSRQLSQRKVGEALSVIGPIGNGFTISDKKQPLLIGGGVGMPPIIAIAQQIKANNYYNPKVFLGSEVPFPFTPVPSKIAKFGAQENRTMPLLESWNIACYLASLEKFDGVFKGFVTELADSYLQGLTATELAAVEVYACGPVPMLKAVAVLAQKYNLPCQVSLEEVMACAVGGCAGCAVKTQTEKGVMMRRVCVDGPVFNAKDVF